MPASGKISVEEYLSTTYRPDCDYVDGEVVERHLGEFTHARTQALVGMALLAQEKQYGVTGLLSPRVQVKPTRFRIPDVCVLAPGAPREEITVHPPFLCVEILSKDDSMPGIMERIDDYFAMGVPNVWIVDPLRRRGYHFTPEGMREAKDGVLRTTNPDLEVSLASLFE
ncbi:MAG TPA: Uma2 family endonuclease [Bryobacteraceae bacterium]